MDIAGTGEMEAQLKNMAEAMGLNDCVTFLGPIPFDRVREMMEKAGIYLFTSDRNEGWGAVLNESMNSGCAAYETITGLWNAEVAAQRLVSLSEHLLAGEKYPDLYEDGPCSRAEIIKDDWF